MNAAQIIRRALLDIDAVLQDSTTVRQYTQIELLTWANEGKDKLEKVLRDAKEDYQVIILQSNDIAFRWSGQTYNPTVLQMTSDTSVYALPPDLVELRSITTITTGQEGILFRYLDSSTDYFKELLTATNAPTSPIYFDVVGERTLLLANTPDTTIDVEIQYIARSAPMQIYTTGTVSISQNSAAVTGTGTRWIIDELQHNLELIVSADATAPKVVSQTAGGTFVDPSRFYYRVDSITADGNLTISAPWLPAAATGRGYMLATVPVIAQEHHHTISKWVAYSALAKVGSSRADKFAASFTADLAEIKSDIAGRQSHDVEYVEAFDP